MSGPASSHSARPVEQKSGWLLNRAKLGDSSALGQLIAGYLPRLRRWAHGRLHRAARSAVDTSDLVQDALLQSLPRVGRIDLSTERALVGYLREAVRNRIHDEHRKIVRHGVEREVSESLVDEAPSPHQLAVTTELEDRYRRALTRLRPSDQALVVGHVELGYSHKQLGRVAGRSANAARMALQRALHQMAEHMLKE